MKPIISIKKIGKKYNITHEKGGYVALRDVITNAIKSPFSYLRTKAIQVAGLETKEDFWALKDINFEVKKGEVIGIIGANGAGKSTLLKILSQITPPTEGEIIIRGRVGSLLEVGTGFHPELTGRENIFLNGAILGMTKKEIVKKFDEIVTFAGIEKFLDTPVKYYSSGMYVRLAFSVAAHMEPDILIVDEVLAVGDAEFQKKCLGKMEEVTKKDGRTILFVSHNMAAIKSLCVKTVWIDNGKINMIGETENVIDSYSRRGEESPTISDFKKMTNEYLDIVFIETNDKTNNVLRISGLNDEIKIKMKIRVKKECKLSLYAILRDKNAQAVAFCSPGHTDNSVFPVKLGDCNIEFIVFLPKLMKGAYFMDLGLSDPGIKTYAELPMAIKIISDGYTNKNNILFVQSDQIGHELLDGKLLIKS